MRAVLSVLLAALSARASNSSNTTVTDNESKNTTQAPQTDPRVFMEVELKMQVRSDATADKLKTGVAPFLESGIGKALVAKGVTDGATMSKFKVSALTMKEIAGVKIMRVSTHWEAKKAVADDIVTKTASASLAAFNTELKAKVKAEFEAKCASDKCLANLGRLAAHVTAAKSAAAATKASTNLITVGATLSMKVADTYSKGAQFIADSHFQTVVSTGVTEALKKVSITTTSMSAFAFTSVTIAGGRVLEDEALFDGELRTLASADKKVTYTATFTIDDANSNKTVDATTGNNAATFLGHLKTETIKAMGATCTTNVCKFTDAAPARRMLGGHNASNGTNGTDGGGGNTAKADNRLTDVTALATTTLASTNKMTLGAEVVITNLKSDTTADKLKGDAKFVAAMGEGMKKALEYQTVNVASFGSFALATVAIGTDKKTVTLSTTFTLDSTNAALTVTKTTGTELTTFSGYLLKQMPKALASKCGTDDGCAASVGKTAHGATFSDSKLLQQATTLAVGATSTTTTTTKPPQKKVTLGITMTMKFKAGTTGDSLKKDTTFKSICETGTKKALSAQGVDTSSFTGFSLTKVTLTAARQLEEEVATPRELAGSSKVATEQEFQMDSTAADNAATEAKKGGFQAAIKDGVNAAIEDKCANNACAASLGNTADLKVTSVAPVTAKTVAVSTGGGATTASGAAEMGLGALALLLSSFSML